MPDKLKGSSGKGPKEVMNEAGDWEPKHGAERRDHTTFEGGKGPGKKTK